MTLIEALCAVQITWYTGDPHHKEKAKIFDEAKAIIKAAGNEVINKEISKHKPVMSEKALSLYTEILKHKEDFLIRLEMYKDTFAISLESNKTRVKFYRNGADGTLEEILQEALNAIKAQE